MARYMEIFLYSLDNKLILYILIYLTIFKNKFEMKAN